MKITLLGTGTSSGVPEIGCQCRTCTSTDSRDKRLRTSILVEKDPYRILIDCGPDFRQQMLRLPFSPIDAVLLTHEHYDHIGGLDDLRPFCKFSNIDIWGLKRTLDVVKRQMPYCFDVPNKPRVPHLLLHPVSAGNFFELKQDGTPPLKVLPVEVFHGSMPILGFRIGKMAFITDMKFLSNESFCLLKGIELLIINGLRHKEHPTHQTIEEAVNLIKELNVPTARIVHLAHTAGLHGESATYLPSGIRFGFDGEIIETDD